MSSLWTCVLTTYFEVAGRPSRRLLSISWDMSLNISAAWCIFPRPPPSFSPRNSHPTVKITACSTLVMQYRYICCECHYHPRKHVSRKEHGVGQLPLKTTFLLPQTNLFDKFLLTSFAINISQNVTSGVQTKICLLAPLVALFCTPLSKWLLRWLVEYAYQ